MGNATMMAYLNRSLTLLALASSLPLLVTACDKGSIGEYGETEGGSDTASSGASDSDSASSAGSASASTTSGGSDTASTSSGSDTASTSGTSGPTSTTTAATEGIVCENPDHACSEPFDCGDNCGGLNMFDDAGCLRPQCANHSECATGELCYRPETFGGCVSSGPFCDDSEGTCLCGGDDDCGGAVCVGAGFYPIEHEQIEEGPTLGARYEDSCAPNDGPAYAYLFGYSSSACDAPVGDDPTLRITVWSPTLLPAGPGTVILDATSGSAWYDANANGMFDDGESASEGILRIQSIDGGALTGEYELLLGTTLLIGSFTDLPYCPVDPLCG